MLNPGTGSRQALILSGALLPQAIGPDWSVTAKSTLSAGAVCILFKVCWRCNHHTHKSRSRRDNSTGGSSLFKYAPPCSTEGDPGD